MASMGEVINAVGSGSGNIFSIMIWIVVLGGLGLLGAGWAAYRFYYKKKWNLKVEIKLLRNDGQYVNGEWGKGYFDAKKGVVLIKRPGTFTPSPMKVFDVRKYLQGTDLLTVLQIAPGIYKPVLNHSWTEYIDDKTGEKAATIDIKVDIGDDKAWQSAFEEAARSAYSLQSLIQQFQTPIAIGIVIICCFVGFAVIWTRLGAIC
jgi:hypothetical protein